MSNSFNISVAPEIAALEAKVDIIDTEVDTIRSTDIPGVVTEVDANETKIDLIRSTDVPNIQTNIDANETKIDTIDGIVDTIKLKTDSLPQTVRGVLTINAVTTLSSSFINVLNINGQGQLAYLWVYCSNGSDTLELKMTLDGVLSNVVSHTGDIIHQALFFSAINPIFTELDIDLSPVSTGLSNIININFAVSLLIEIRRSAGTVSSIVSKAAYSLDTF